MANSPEFDYAGLARMETSAAAGGLPELLAAFDQPDPDMDLIIRLMSNESALAAKVLRLSNSATFGGAERATDLFEAISRIGVYQAAEAARAFCRSMAARPKFASSAATANSAR